MKIAVFSSFPPRKCGIAHLTINLFDELRAQGHMLVTFGVGDDSACDHKIDSDTLFGLRKAVSVIEQEGIDRVSVQFIIGFFGKKFLGLNFLAFLWALRKKRVIVTLHELHYLRSFGQLFRNPLDLFHFALEGLIARLCAGVIVHTETQASILRKYGAPRVRCVYLGILPRPVARTETPRNRALFFGKLAPIKGVHHFAGIARACPEIRFTLACSCESPYEEYKRSLIRDFAGIGNIEFICKDWIEDDEKEGYFAAADVLVLPYDSGHYQSGAASESGVYNIPVIVTALGPLVEIPRKYGNGEVVSSPDPLSVKAAIGKIFANYPSYLEGIRKYREYANWSAAARKYVEYLQG